MKSVNCEKCKTNLSLDNLFDIIMDKIEKECHAFDVFKCSNCEHMNQIPVNTQLTNFK